MLLIKEAIKRHNKANPKDQYTCETLAWAIMPEKKRGTAKNILSKWCNGQGYAQFTPERACRISEILNCSIDELFGNE